MKKTLIIDNKINNTWIFKKLNKEIGNYKNYSRCSPIFIFSMFFLVIILLVTNIYIKENAIYYGLIPLILFMIVVPIVLIKIDMNKKKKIIIQWIKSNINDILDFYKKNKKNVSIEKFTFELKKDSYGKRKNIDTELITQAILSLEIFLQIKQN